jgi:hypothetical protein
VIIKYGDSFVGCDNNGLVLLGSTFDDQYLWIPIERDDGSVSFLSDSLYYLDVDSSSLRLICKNMASDFGKFTVQPAIGGKPYRKLINDDVSKMSEELSLHDAKSYQKDKQGQNKIDL